MKRLKYFMTGFVSASVVMGMLSVNAAGITKTIEAVVNSAGFKVNGKDVVVDNFLYNGTLYIPLRAAAEMLDKDVSWDAENNIAIIKDKTQAVPAPSAAPLEKKNTQSPGLIISFTSDTITFLDDTTGEINLTSCAK